MKAKNVELFFNRFFIWRADEYVIFGYYKNGSYRSILSFKTSTATRPQIVETSFRSRFLNTERGSFSDSIVERY